MNVWSQESLEMELNPKRNHPRTEGINPSAALNFSLTTHKTAEAALTMVDLSDPAEEQSLSVPFRYVYTYRYLYFVVGRT